MGDKGRLGIVVDGKTAAALEVDGGRTTLTPGDGGGPVRATVSCRSVADFERVMRGELNLVVVALRGELAISGDVPFAVRALRTAGAHGLGQTTGAQPAGAETPDAKGG